MTRREKTLQVLKKMVESLTNEKVETVIDQEFVDDERDRQTLVRVVANQCAMEVWQVGLMEVKVTFPGRSTS